MPEPTPEAWALIRHAYEHTDKPLAHICAEHDISIPTLRYRMKVWQWRKRKPLIPREGPPPVLPPVVPGRDPQAASAESVSPAPRRMDSGPAAFATSRNDEECETILLQDPPTPTVFAAAHTVDPPPPGEGEAAADPATIVPRLLPAIEGVIARLASGPHSPHAMAQAARALGALTRTLRELNTLLAQHQAGGPQGRCPRCEDIPEDMDAIRFELARRIDAFIASRQTDHG